MQAARNRLNTRRSKDFAMICVLRKATRLCGNKIDESYLWGAIAIKQLIIQIKQPDRPKGYSAFL